MPSPILPMRKHEMQNKLLWFLGTGVNCNPSTLAGLQGIGQFAHDDSQPLQDLEFKPPMQGGVIRTVTINASTSPVLQSLFTNNNKTSRLPQVSLAPPHYTSCTFSLTLKPLILIPTIITWWRWWFYWAGWCWRWWSSWAGCCRIWWWEEGPLGSECDVYCTVEGSCGAPN